MRNGLTEANGIHIVIEDSRKSPSIISNGISVQPGTETNIGLKMSKISRLKTPFESSCIEDYKSKLFNVTFLNRFEYSSKNCKSWCYLILIIAYCDCFEQSLIEGVFAREFVGWQDTYNFKYCQQEIGSEDEICVKNVTTTLPQEYLTDLCSCGAECLETEFKVNDRLKFQ